MSQICATKQGEVKCETCGSHKSMLVMLALIALAVVAGMYALWFGQ